MLEVWVDHVYYLVLVEQVAGGGDRVVGVRVADEFVLLQERKSLLVLRGFDPQPQFLEAVLSVDAGFTGGFVGSARGDTCL